SQKMAVRLRGGMLPQASGSPAERRATRDRVRRRLPLMRPRAARLAPVHTPNSPYHLPEIGQQSASKANRDGVAERYAAPAVPKSMAVALALMDDDDRLRTDLALPIVQRAKQHAANPGDRQRSVPGVGQLLALGLR